MTAPYPMQRRTAAERWELPAWSAVLLVALALRVYDLGMRVMSHDESIHAFGALTLFRNHLYRHDPTYHGPLQYFVNAAVYSLFGATDFTARLAPALTGTALIAALWPFRRFLGAKGALAAGVLATISPALLFYSRYIREDVYVAFFGLVWVYAAFRFLEERRASWLFFLTGAMAFAFIAKENSFMLGAAIGSFFAARALVRSDRPSDRAVRGAAADLAVLMLTLVLPFASGLAYMRLGWRPTDPLPPGRNLLAFGAVVAGLFAAGAALAWWRFRSSNAAAGETHVTRRTWLRLMALFWSIQLVFFTSLFSRPLHGVLSGIGGSVGYWLSQHGVNRGSQPIYYYLVVGGLYEFLPMIVGAAAIAIVLWRMRDRSWDPAAGEPACAAGDDARHLRRLFVAFSVWWIAGSWVLYAWAGERMPWLLVHQLTPLCLLAGWAVAALVREIRRDSVRAVLPIVFGAAAVLVLFVGILRTSPSSGRDVASVAETAGWWTRALMLCALVAFVVPWFRVVRLRMALRLTCLGLVLVLGVLTVRTALRLAFVNYDLAAEPMSYAQGSPDIRRAMQLIEALSERTAGARALEVAYDDQSAWPIAWYLRDYRNARTWGTDPAFVRSAPVVLVGPKNRDALRPHVAGGYVSHTYIHYWWPIQDYLNLTPSRVLGALLSPATREHLWQVFFHRDYGVPPDRWPSRRDFDVFVRRDLAASPFPDPSAAPAVTLAAARGAAEIDWKPLRIIDGPMAGKPLLRPTAITVAADGSRVVADTGNHRVVVIGRDGALRRIVGNGRCDLRDAAQPGCVDPDGGGPMAKGDGQFNEPWGVAMSDAGELFVADTWNGRIQVFDGSGRFRRAWGRFGAVTADAAQELRLYGPRGLALDEAGNLLVADTGNKRLLVFSPDGALLADVGPSTPSPEFFDEPTGVARDSNGTLLVADAWNARVVRIDRRRQTLAAWRVAGWSGRSPEHKPFVASDSAGLVYASDPESGRVLVFSPAGAPEAILRPAASAAHPVSPTGLAFDAVAGEMLVVDRANGRVLVMPAYGPSR
jgi:uncharacterized protein (TIGR03663 family)